MLVLIIGMTAGWILACCLSLVRMAPVVQRKQRLKGPLEREQGETGRSFWSGITVYGTLEEQNTVFFQVSVVSASSGNNF